MQSASPKYIGSILKPLDAHQNVTTVTEEYLGYYNKKRSEEEELERRRKENYKDLSSTFYDLASDFYEHGWGESFHFARIYRGHSREHMITKHEYWMALKLGIKPRSKVVDLGCGIGGPMRHLATFTGADFTGLNSNQYQVHRANELTEKVGLTHLCRYIEGNFCDAPFKSDTFDAAYAMEATCHAGDLTSVYGEVLRILKPGGLFGCYEWVMTEEYDPQNPKHAKVKDDLLVGNGLADLLPIPQVLQSVKRAGFELVESEDLALSSEIPWHHIMLPSTSLWNFRTTPLGRWLTHAMLYILETFRIVPQGACKVHSTLQVAARGIIGGGHQGIFTPMFYFLARKPIVTQ